MKAGPPGYLWAKYECFLMSGCRDMNIWKNLEIKLCRSVTGTRTRTTGVTAIALLVLRTGELKRRMEFLHGLQYHNPIEDKHVCQTHRNCLYLIKTVCKPFQLKVFGKAIESVHDCISLRKWDTVYFLLQKKKKKKR